MVQVVEIEKVKFTLPLHGWGVFVNFLCCLKVSPNSSPISFISLDSSIRLFINSDDSREINRKLELSQFYHNRSDNVHSGAVSW